MNPLKILIVDDDVQSQRMLCLILKHAGHIAKVASNGIEAVEIVKSGDLDLVLMDVQMPLMDGFEATRQIREWEDGGSHLAIVGLTAVLDSEYGKCLQSGMDGIISKPFDPEEFHELVTGFVDKNRAVFKKTVETAPGGSPILDVRGAVKRLAGDRENYILLLEEFVMSLPGKLDELTDDLESADWQNLSSRAHNLKGLSAGLGAVELSRKALELELCMNENRYSQAKRKINEINDSIKSLKAEALILFGSHHGLTGTPIH